MNDGSQRLYPLNGRRENQIFEVVSDRDRHPWLTMRAL